MSKKPTQMRPAMNSIIQLRRVAEMELPTLVEPKHVKESTMGSYENVKQIATCYHEWIPRPAVLFGYMHVDAQCTKCETWWAA